MWYALLGKIAAALLPYLLNRLIRRKRKATFKTLLLSLSIEVIEWLSDYLETYSYKDRVNMRVSPKARHVLDAELDKRGYRKKVRAMRVTVADDRR